MRHAVGAIGALGGRSVEESTVPAQPRVRWLAWLPLIAGALLAVMILDALNTHFVVRLLEEPTGMDTAYARYSRGPKTQCTDNSNSQKCIADWRKAGSPQSALWFGNSQLHTINRQRPGDINAPEFVRRRLAERGYYLVTYSQPNANLTEQTLIWNAIGPVYKPRLVILAVCYDDIRELGVRDTVGAMMKDRTVAARVQSQPYWPLMAKPLMTFNAPAKPEAKKDVSLQAYVEKQLTESLAENWPLWKARQGLRGALGYAIHVTRNSVLGIHSTSKRPVNPGVYRDRLRLLEGMVQDMQAQGTSVLLYAPPYRQDIDGPYPMADYRAFKRDLAALAARYGATFLDIDPIVPGPEWGTVPELLFGLKEPDFMHFNAVGHARLGEAIDKETRRMGY